MKLRERYKRLNLWNKIAFWGSFASIIGFLVTILLLLLPSPLTSIEEAVTQGDTFLENKRFEEAVQSYAMALRVDPRDASIWRKRGISYIGLATGTTRFRDAIDKCRDVDVQYFLKALPVLTKAVHLDPHDKEAYLYRGVVYYRWGNLHPMLGPANNTENAYSQFHKAATLPFDRPNIDPYKWQYETSCAYYGMALVIARLSQRMDRRYAEEAGDLWQKALETAPLCAPSDVTLEQLLSLTRKLPSDPGWAFLSPPDPYR